MTGSNEVDLDLSEFVRSLVERSGSVFARAARSMARGGLHSVCGRCGDEQHPSDEQIERYMHHGWPTICGRRNALPGWGPSRLLRCGGELRWESAKTRDAVGEDG